MSRRKPTKSEVLVGQPRNGGPAYILWTDAASQKNAFQAMGEAIQESMPISHQTSAYNRDYSNLAPNVSGRPGLTRNDYDYFRPSEAVPTDHKNITLRCNLAYMNNGLIKNIIDLMGDFGCQGIRLVHRNKSQERFYQNWFKIVKGVDRSERFLNNLYRSANVVLRKQTAKVPMSVQDKMYKTFASPDFKVTDLSEFKPEKAELPWRYTFLNPATVEPIGGPLSSFTGSPRYALCLPTHLANIINAPKTEIERELVDKLPPDVRAAAKSRKPYPLPPDKTLVFHYKKDDWCPWATPMIHSIMDNIITLEKLQLADNAALDGAISNIRIFKLGSLQHKIAPTRHAVLALSEILQNHTGTGSMDLVWGPDIELIESKTTIHQFLGEDKYKPTLNAIYAGMGIPPTLTGTFGAAGTTNNFISLKTLTERLQYGREVLISFWEKEIVEVQRAMGFRFPATIEFDLMTLADEEAIKNLYISLADRQIISDEALQGIFGTDPQMEKIRLNREARERTSGKMVEKAGPFHDPQIGDGLKKIALQSGISAPSEVGLELKPRKKGEKSGMDFKAEQQKEKKKKGEAGQGRPKGKKDSSKRKKKTFSPKSKATELWAKEAQDKIAVLLNDGILATFGKANLRKLTNEEVEIAEKLKFGVLSNIAPLTFVTEEVVAQALDSPASEDMTALLSRYVKQTMAELNRKLTLDELKNIQATVYSEIINGEYSD